MLMVDSLDMDGIRRTDVPLIRLLGGLPAVALAKLKGEAVQAAQE